MDDASDDLASSIFSFIEDNGVLPNLGDIRNTDAQTIVDSLIADGHDVDLSIWSGNLLFVGLGDTQPLEDNLLTTSTEGAYDLTAAIQSIKSVDFSTLLGAGFSSFGTVLSNTGAGILANTAMSNYWDALYYTASPNVIQSFTTTNAFVDLQGNLGTGPGS